VDVWTTLAFMLTEHGNTTSTQLPATLHTVDGWMERIHVATDRNGNITRVVIASTHGEVTSVIFEALQGRQLACTPNGDPVMLAFGPGRCSACRPWKCQSCGSNGHVRGDILYGFFKPRTQAFFDLLLYLVFFLPGVIALAWAGYSFAGDSWAIREHSSISADGPPLYPFKTVIPIAGALLLLQGLVEILRCVVCLRDGEWPSREQDVEEVDVDKLKAMVTHESDTPPGVSPSGPVGGR
jgi:hypothetical protein